MRAAKKESTFCMGEQSVCLPLGCSVCTLSLGKDASTEGALQVSFQEKKKKKHSMSCTLDSYKVHGSMTFVVWSYLYLKPNLSHFDLTSSS